MIHNLELAESLLVITPPALTKKLTITKYVPLCHVSLCPEAGYPAGSNIAPRSLLGFKHDKALGAAPSHKLFDLVTVAKKPRVEVPRAFSDYTVTIDEAAIPSGVTLIRRI